MNNLGVYQNYCGWLDSLGQHVYCVVSLSAAVAVVLIQVSRCKGIHLKQIGRLGSLECATTVFDMSKSQITPYLENKAFIQKSKTIKFKKLSR